MEEKDISDIYDQNLFKLNDFDVLLHKILKHARSVLNSEAGSIYIIEGDSLSFNVFQNDAMSYENIYKQFYSLKDVKLSLTEQEKYLAVKSFISNKIITIDDVYEVDEFDFLGVKEFDKRFNYRTKSIITAPIVHPIENKKLGVLQLLNKSENNQSVPFTKKDKEVISMVSSFIALSISKAQDDIEKLKMVNEELEIANKQLEKRIKKEVLESEKKSAIIYHQSKLAFVGEMIGNIAHQWRQPLSAISTIASGLSLYIEMGNYNKNNAKSSLDNIVKTTKHLSQTIDDFRNFYKKDKSKNFFNLKENIKQSLSIVEASLLSEYIEVIKDFDDSLEIFGYENEMKQAFLNIIQNSYDALIENISKDEKRYIFISAKKIDGKIIVEIKDNALGIADNVMAKIFEQNFTTKENHGGTGIGLYMTNEIIKKNMNGTIKVSNCEYVYKDKKCKGALFIITI